jgi:UDP-galactopyranose mutase
MKYDYIVVGAGIAGITIARCLADKNKKVLILEKRNSIGGNCFDERINDILVHKYGPHIFHTDNEKVWNYLNQFTSFNDYKHKVKVEVDNMLVTLPINIDSLEELGLDRSENSIQYISENVYKNYSKKQWGKYFGLLDKSVFNRVPIRYDHNSDYFLDKFQGLPTFGYTNMFQNMLFHENIELKLNKQYTPCTYNDGQKIVYTGSIDEIFNYQYGYLSYRSLDIEFKEYDKPFYQDYPVINYPNKKRLTRKTEYKYLTQQESDNTIISKEYPCEYDGANIPYYPVPTKETSELYNKYKELADKISNLYLLGRLAEYKYYDMDDVVEKALNLAEEI